MALADYDMNLSPESETMTNDFVCQNLITQEDLTVHAGEGEEEMGTRFMSDSMDEASHSKAAEQSDLLELQLFQIGGQLSKTSYRLQGCKSNRDYFGGSFKASSPSKNDSEGCRSTRDSASFNTRAMINDKGLKKQMYVVRQNSGENTGEKLPTLAIKGNTDVAFDKNRLEDEEAKKDKSKLHHHASRPKVPKLTIKTKTLEYSPQVSKPSLPTNVPEPSTTSMLLSLMSEAIPKYTSVSALPSSSPPPLSHSLSQPDLRDNGTPCSVPSTNRASPLRDDDSNEDSHTIGNDESSNSCSGLLRDMIEAPSATFTSSLRAGSAPRQDLSRAAGHGPEGEQTACTSTPKAASKLDKDIGCLCKHNKGKPCWMVFQEEHLKRERLHHLQMKRETLDLVILAKVAANINREDHTRYHPSKARQRSRINYLHEGRPICRETFLYIHGICKGRLCRLISHYKAKGITTRVHKNVNTTPKHALSPEDTDNVLNFVRDYASKHCESSYRCKSGSTAGGDLLIMSKNQSKRFVHHKYKVWCAQNGLRAVALSSFQILWNKHLPHIVVLRGSNKCPVPESDSVQLPGGEINREIGNQSCLEGVDELSHTPAGGIASLTCSSSQDTSVPGRLHVSRGTSIDLPTMKRQSDKSLHNPREKQVGPAPSTSVGLPERSCASSHSVHSIPTTDPTCASAPVENISSASPNASRPTDIQSGNSLAPSHIIVTIRPSKNQAGHLSSINGSNVQPEKTNQIKQVPLPRVSRTSKDITPVLSSPRDPLLYPHTGALQSSMEAQSISTETLGVQPQSPLFNDSIQGSLHSSHLQMHVSSSTVPDESQSFLLVDSAGTLDTRLTSDHTLLMSQTDVLSADPMHPDSGDTHSLLHSHSEEISRLVQSSDHTPLLSQIHSDVPMSDDSESLLLPHLGGTTNLGHTPDWQPWTSFASL